MSKNETPLTLAYWEQLDEDSALVEEYRIFTDRRRNIDGVAIFGRKREPLPRYQNEPIRGEDVAVIQTKPGRLTMGLLGQTIFSSELIEHQEKPRSIRSVALCTRDTPALHAVVPELSDRLEIAILRSVVPEEESGTPRAARQLREEMLTWVHGANGGLLIRPYRLRLAGQKFTERLDAVLLTERASDECRQDEVEIDPNERVVIVQAADPIGMSVMGRALVARSLLRHLLGFQHVDAIVLYPDTRDDAILRELLTRHEGLSAALYPSQWL